MSDPAAYKRNTAFMPLLPVLLVLLAYLGWTYFENERPDPYETYDRDLPPLTAPAAAPFDDPALPYTFTIPAGLTAMPDTEGADVRLAPEAWFPTEAAISVTARELDDSTDGLSDKELLAVAIEDDDGPGEGDDVTITVADDGSRVLTWPGCCDEPAPVRALVYRGKHVALIESTTPSDSEDSQDAVGTAAQELLASFAWR